MPENKLFTQRFYERAKEFSFIKITNMTRLKNGGVVLDAEAECWTGRFLFRTSRKMRPKEWLNTAKRRGLDGVVWYDPAQERVAVIFSASSN